MAQPCEGMLANAIGLKGLDRHAGCGSFSCLMVSEQVCGYGDLHVFTGEHMCTHVNVYMCM